MKPARFRRPLAAALAAAAAALVALAACSPPRSEEEASSIGDDIRPAETPSGPPQSLGEAPKESRVPLEEADQGADQNAAPLLPEPPGDPFDASPERDLHRLQAELETSRRDLAESEAERQRLEAAQAQRQEELERLRAQLQAAQRSVESNFGDAQAQRGGSEEPAAPRRPAAAPATAAPAPQAPRPAAPRAEAPGAAPPAPGAPARAAATRGFTLDSVPDSAGASVPASSAPAPQDCDAEGETGGFQCVELYFGVDRGLTSRGSLLAQYGPETFGDSRSYNVLFLDDRDESAPRDEGWYRTGRLVVTLPKTRQPGDPILSIRSPHAEREITARERSRLFAPYSIEMLEGDSFWSQLTDALQGADENALLLYVHGFNVCFDGAAYRTAQLAYDLGFKGRAAFFSWPANCEANFLDYARDISLGLTAEKDLERFLVDIKEKAHPSKLILISHSHGGALVADALRDAYGRTLEKGDVDVVVFAAADVDEEAFRRFAVDAADLYHAATLYASSRDLATGAREALARVLGDVNRRVGFFFGPAPVTVPKVQTVDVSRGSLDIFGGDPRLLDFGPGEILLNHSTYAESPEIVADMKALIAHPVDDATGAPVEPHVRSAGQIELVCYKDQRFWRLAAGGAGKKCRQ